MPSSFRNGSLLAALALTAAVLCLAMPETAVHAEDQGMIVRLSYLQGYSNYGPTNVYGSAHLWPKEGVAELTVHLLPPQSGGSQYASWLVNTTSGEAMLLGRFNTNDAGDATQDIVFSSTMPQAANAVVVTVVRPGDPASLPGPIRSVAGTFPSQHIVPLVTPHPTPAAPPARAHTHNGTAPAQPRHGSSTAQGGHHASGAHKGTAPTSASHHPVVMLPTTGGGPAARRLEHQAASHRPRHRRPKRNTVQLSAAGPAPKGAWQATAPEGADPSGRVPAMVLQGQARLDAVLGLSG